MNRERLDDWCGRGILLLTLVILAFGTLAFGAVRAQEFLVIEGLAVAATALWLLRLWLNPRARLLWPPVCWAVLAFAAYAVARYFTADIEYVARHEAVRVLIYTLIFFTVLNNLHRQESIQTISITLVFLAMAVSFYAICQFVTGSNRVWNLTSPYPHRAGGTYVCPNHLAGFLEMLLPLALAWTTTSREKIPMKIFLGYAAVVMAAGMVVTMSRGGWLACGGGLSAFGVALFARRTLRWPALAALALVSATAAVLLWQSPTARLRLATMLDKDQKTRQVEEIRFSLWQPAAKMWRDHFWWGVGPAHFDERFRAYRPQNVQMKPEFVHNDYLNTLADWGAAGFALVAAVWVVAGAGVAKTWKFVRGGARDLGGNQSDKFAFVLGASAGLFALLLHSFVDFNFHVPANAILAVTLLALLTSHLRFATEACWVTPSVALKTALTIFLLAAITALGAQSVRHARELLCLARAARAEEGSPAHVAALQDAFAVEPKNFSTTHALGEHHRLRSLEGDANYADEARLALGWYARGLKLNPHADGDWLGSGICLDWLGRHDEAAAAFANAEALDPNGSFTAAYLGWHQVQLGDYAAARECFSRSLRLEWNNNYLAKKYLEVVDRRLRAEAAPR